MRLSADARHFEDLLPLLRHGAMESTDEPVADGELASTLRRSFEEASVCRFVKDARVLSGAELAIRIGDVRLRTEDALSATFSPPPADHVASSLGMALRYIETSLFRHLHDPAKAATCALLGSQILLTIHPFSDGNGRTARMYFAAKTLRHAGPVPGALLGLMLMYRGGAHRYHLASWELRAGNVEPMAELFAESVRAANELFSCRGDSSDSKSFTVRCWRDLRALR